MSDMDFETRLHSIAREMVYPPTPDVAASVMAQLRPATGPRLSLKALAWSLTLIIVLCSSLMLIPPARAAILEFIQIGIVRIFPRPTESPVETVRTPSPDTMVPVTATPFLEVGSLLKDLDQIAGERTLSQAQDIAVSFYTLRLPSYPMDLGPPDHVYVQDAAGSMTILLWLNPDDPETVLISLYMVPEGSWAIHKAKPVTIQETRVNGQLAVWAVGPYPLWLSNGDLVFTRLIDGQVLIWTEGDITYRLETALPLDEAVRIAESLQPIP